MLKIDSSDWFLEFEYDGEVKRIHRFAHIPLDLVLDANGKELGVSEVFDRLLMHDCGLRISDFDTLSAKALIDELSQGGESLGE